jgi:hypothetical protein
VRNILKIGINSLKNSNYTLTILNLSGQKIYQENFTGIAGYDEKIIAVNKLTNGMYHIKLSNSNNTIATSTTFLKQ